MTSPNEPPVLFCETPCEAWEAIYADCEKARMSIICEHYIMDDDSVGQRFLDLFIAKAKAGVEIILVLDGIGSRRLISSPQITALRNAGGIVHFYNPPTLWLFMRPWRWLPRNHNKIVLIDFNIGHMGSACFQQAMCDWRDIHVRFTGALAHSLHTKVKSVEKFLSNNASSDSYPAPSPPNNMDADLSYAISQPHLRRNPIYRNLLQRIRHARHRILLVTPYFLPPRRLRKALLKAAKRGIEVTLMISQHTDVPTADCVSRSYFPLLLRHNIHILMFQKNILHAKYVVIDDDYAMVGSANLDYLSLLRNHETNMIIYNHEIIARLTSQFDKDATECRKVDWNYWHRLSWFYRLCGYVGRIGRKVM